MMLGASTGPSALRPVTRPPRAARARVRLSTRPYLVTTRPYLVTARTYLLPTRTYLPRAGIGRPLEYFTREYDHTNAAHHLALGFKSPADAERFKELVWPQVLARAK